MTPSNRRRLRAEVESRGIAHLLHFTPFENLEGILGHGLLPRSTLDRTGMAYLPTDGLRLDGRREAVSLSITDVNALMFARKRELMGPDWAILILDPGLLWEMDCEFNHRNAASSAMRWRHHRKGWAELAWMFHDPEPGYRDRIGLAPSQPTFQDAEVQVFGAIPPERLLGVLVTGSASLASRAWEPLRRLNARDGGDRDVMDFEDYLALRDRVWTQSPASP